MKLSKKLIISSLLASVFACTSLTCINANAKTYGYNSVDQIKDKTEQYEWLMENGIEEAKFVVIDEGVTYNYYYNGNGGYEYVGLPFIKSEDEVEIPEDVKQVITINFDNNTIEGAGENGYISEIHHDAYIDDNGEEVPAVDYTLASFVLVAEDYSFYQYAMYTDVGNYWSTPISLNPIEKIEKDDTTIGDSENKPITEVTVGDSTFPRGDINLDGKVNTVDLLMLKKYLLGLMEW